MGADRHRERMNIINAQEEPPEPPYRVIAVDASGDEVYEAESAWSEKEAMKIRKLAIEKFKECPDRFDDDVYSFEIKNMRNP